MFWLPTHQVTFQKEEPTKPIWLVDNRSYFNLNSIWFIREQKSHHHRQASTSSHDIHKAAVKLCKTEIRTLSIAFRHEKLFPFDLFEKYILSVHGVERSRQVSNKNKRNSCFGVIKKTEESYLAPEIFSISHTFSKAFIAEVPYRCQNNSRSN